MGKILHFAFVVMVTTAAATALLASLNFATLDRIKSMDMKTQTEARNTALSDAVKFDESKEITSGNTKFIPGMDSSGKIIGYVATVNSPGYGAKGIVYVLGIGTDGKVKGMKVTDATAETPGLGSNVTKEEWQKHWTGKDKNYQFDKSVDGFAGATISPKGVYSGMIAALKDFDGISSAVSNTDSNKTVVDETAKIIEGGVYLDNGKAEKSGDNLFTPVFGVEGIILGYITEVSCKGYGNKPIKFILGIGIDGKVKKLKITDVSGETPDIGQNVVTEEWQDHWIGKDKEYKFNKSVDVTAGATYTSKGICDGMNSALQNFTKVKGAQANGQK